MSAPDPGKVEIRAALTPGARFSSKRVMTGPRIVHHISFNAEIRQTRFNQTRHLLQRKGIYRFNFARRRRQKIFNEGSGVTGRCNGRLSPLRINSG